jgi:hypothetical protein
VLEIIGNVLKNAALFFLAVLAFTILLGPAAVAFFDLVCLFISQAQCTSIRWTDDASWRVFAATISALVAVFLAISATS